ERLDDILPDGRRIGLAVFEADRGHFDLPGFLGGHAEETAATTHAHATTAAAEATAAGLLLTALSAAATSAATATAAALSQHGHAGKHVGKFHVDRLVGVVLDEHVRVKGILRDETNVETLVLDALKQVDCGSIRGVGVPAGSFRRPDRC